MKFLKNKKGFVTHPVLLFATAVAIGVAVGIVWAQGVVGVQFPFC